MKRRDAETPKEDEVTDQIIGAAIEGHRHLGSGLLESGYEECLCYEFSLRGLKFRRQVPMPVAYKSTKLACGYKIDLLVEDSVIVNYFSETSASRLLGVEKDPLDVPALP